MGTSLAEQLKKLTVPQTSVLTQEKKWTSLLFNPKEAANLDRDTIYEIGIRGLEELKKLNPRFGEFQNTLFNLLSKSLQRSVESQVSNRKLDKEIQKFLFLLSPYFQLRPAHMTLEWLISRFQIHLFNVDDVLMLILPYHGTRMFVRLLQLLNIKDPINRWHWLCPLQNSGAPLSKIALLNHCASNASFLHFVCRMTMLAVKEYGSNATMLSTLFSFCCTTIVGALEYSNAISEVQVTHIFKLLLKGLTSHVLDYSAASIIIMAQLARKTQLSKELLFNIVNQIPKNVHKVLQVEWTMLLVLLYQLQHELVASFPHKALMRLAKCPTFPTALSSVMLSGGHVIPVLAPLLAEILKTIQTQPETETENIEELKSFAENLLTEINLDNESAETIIRTVINSFDEYNCKIEASPDELAQWYSAYLSRLERQYSTVFDRVIQDLLYGRKSSSHQKKALRIILGFLPRISLSQGDMDIFEKLHHHNEQMRVEAVQYLVSTYSKPKFVLQEQDKQILVDSLKDRLKDDSIEVVNAVLSFPAPVLANFIGSDQLLETLTSLAARFWYFKGKMLPVVKRTLECLCSDTTYDTTTVLLCILPYLLPTKNKKVNLALVVLNSTFGRTNLLLKAVSEDIGDLNNIPSAQRLCSVVFHKMTQLKYLPSNAVLTEAIHRNPYVKTEVVYKFVATILLTTTISEQATPQEIWAVLDSVLEYTNDSKVSVAHGTTPLCDILPACMATASCKKLPLQAFIHCLSRVVSCVSLPEQIKGQPWWDLTSPNKTAMLLLIKIFEILIKGCSQESILKTAYIGVLKEFFETHFSQLSDRIGFLCNLWVGHELQDVVDYELQLRSLLLATAMLRQTELSIGWILKLQNLYIVPSLLVAITCPLSPVRVAALDFLTVISKSISSSLKKNSYIHLVEELLENREELKIDPEQLPVIFYKVLAPDSEVQSLIKQSRKPYMSNILEALIQCILNEHTPMYVCSALLRILAHVNSSNIFRKLCPLGKRIILQNEEQEYQMNCYMSAILRNILSRLTHGIVEHLQKDCWEFFYSVLGNCKTLVYAEDGRLTCPAVLAMEQISKEVFESAPSQQHTLLTLLVNVGTYTDSPDVVSAVAAVGKRIILDCKIVVTELEKMIIESTTHKQVLRRRSINAAPSLDVLKLPSWRRGITLLELIQNKKKLHSVHLLLPVLFDILKRCLEFEEQTSIEYTKQLILSCILHCCQKLSPDGSPVSPDLIDLETTLNVELVVQCIRATQNPQTHHHALLLLSQTAGMIPKQVLHNIMAIFTFMGSSILRQDDAYSFQVISKIVETIIPIVIKANDTSPLPANLCDAVAIVMRVFVDALLDVPEHRRLPLFYKLLTTLEAHRFLWLLQCLVLENQVLQDSDPSPTKEGPPVPKRVEFLLNLTHMFAPHTVIHNCVNIMIYVRSLPANKEDKWHQKATSRAGGKTEDCSITSLKALFNVERHTAKQLRHFKYSLITYLSSLLSSPLFVNQIASLNEDDTSEMEPLYTNLIENVLQYIQLVSREAEVNLGTPTAKYWRVMLNQGYDILDKVNALLHSDMFVLVIRGLLDNKILTVRRKAMELLNARLQHHQFFSSCNHRDLFTVLPPLIGIIRTISNEDEGTDLDQQLIQQTALLCVKMLARHITVGNSAQFKEILLMLTELLKTKTLQGNILASTVLCVAELFSTLRAFALESLPKFMPVLIKILHNEKYTESPDVVLLGIVSSVYKVVESLPHFLSPYLEKLLVGVSLLSARWHQELENTKVTPIVQKLKCIRQNISSTIPPRVLIPSVSKGYSKLLQSEQYAALGPLMDVLAGSFSMLSGSEFKQLQPELTAFFLSALEFRADCANRHISQDEVFLAEGHVIQALVALVLKLSESSFRPLYYSLFHWATGADLHKDRIITFYRCSSSIADCLKGLFVLFAGHFLKNAADMLDQNNAVKVESLYFGSGKAAEMKSDLLVQFVLKTLHSVFLYDSQNFINKERFETLMLPIVNQLENTMGGSKALQFRASSLVTPCIAQFAVDVADDVLWKHLNYQLLLKTRHNLPQVRLVALETFCAIVRKLGEDFLPLLPETVPFLAELLEDEDEEVEKACQKTVQDLEEILGEPLKKYF